MPRHTRYYFGRLNIIPVQAEAEKHKLLIDGLTHRTFLGKRGVMWGFYKVAELGSNQGTFLQGYLVKYRPETQEEVAVPETRQLDEQTIENLVSAKAHFFLHIASGLIAYHPGGEIPRRLFTTRFVELLEQALGNFFVDAEIQTIDEPYRILEAIKQFSRISCVSIYLHPSNPALRDIWKDTDERLKRLGTASYRERYIASKQGTLHLQDDPQIHRGFAMAEDGYGRAEVVGVLDERPITVSTADSPMAAVVEGGVTCPPFLVHA